MLSAEFPNCSRCCWLELRAGAKCLFKLKSSNLLFHWPFWFCVLGYEHLPVRRQATECSTSSSDEEFESKPSLRHKVILSWKQKGISLVGLFLKFITWFWSKTCSNSSKWEWERWRLHVKERKCIKTDEHQHFFYLSGSSIPPGYASADRGGPSLTNRHVPLKPLGSWFLNGLNMWPNKQTVEKKNKPNRCRFPWG